MKRMMVMGVALMMALAFSAQIRAAEEAEAKPVEATAYTGKAGCAHCNFAEQTGAKHCGLAFKSGDHVYLVKAGKEGDEALNGALTKKTFKGDLKVTGKVVKGEDGKEWLLAEKVEKAEAEKKAE